MKLLVAKYLIRKLVRMLGSVLYETFVADADATLVAAKSYRYQR